MQLTVPTSPSPDCPLSVPRALSPLCPKKMEALRHHSSLVLGDAGSISTRRLRLKGFLQVCHPAPGTWGTWHVSQAQKKARDSCQEFSPTSAMRSHIGANPPRSSEAVTSSPFSKTNTHCLMSHWFPDIYKICLKFSQRWKIIL